MVVKVPSECIGYVTGARRAALGNMEEDLSHRIQATAKASLHLQQCCQEWGTLMFFMNKEAQNGGGKATQR